MKNSDNDEKYFFLGSKCSGGITDNSVYLWYHWAQVNLWHMGMRQLKKGQMGEETSSRLIRQVLKKPPVLILELKKKR